MITIHSAGRPEAVGEHCRYRVCERAEGPHAYTNDRKLARLIAEAMAIAGNSHPIVWDDGQT